MNQGPGAEMCMLGFEMSACSIVVVIFVKFLLTYEESLWSLRELKGPF